MLTCGRVEETRRTFDHNIKGIKKNNPNIDIDLYWWDNSTDPLEAAALEHIVKKYRTNITKFKHPRNAGISRPLNTMMCAAFNAGADMVTTMANDILEPDNYIQARTIAIQTFPQAGIISIPIHQQDCNRYPKRNEQGINIEEGHVIGNYTIPRSVWKLGIEFCEDMGIYGPIDLDFCNQVWAAKMRCLYLSDLEAIHIGTNNPPEYQKAKDESLAASWEIYSQRSAQFAKHA